MRRLITGVKNGLSCIVDTMLCDPVASELSIQRFIEFSATALPQGLTRKGAFVDLHLAQGCIRWITVHYPPNSTWPGMHHTDSIDCHTVISGSVDIILDDGAHTIAAGDCLIVTGVDHAWRTGQEGGTSSILLIGAAPPAAA